MRKKLLKTSVLVAAMLGVSPAFAQSTANVTITSLLTVQDGCVINGGASLALINFGTVANPGARTDDIRGNTQASGSPIVVSCNVNSSAATFQINAGNNDSGGVHRLRNITGVGGAPGEFLEYRLFSSATLSPASEYQISNPLPANGGTITAGVPFEIVVFGRILNAQAVQAVAGIYQDITQGVLTF